MKRHKARVTEMIIWLGVTWMLAAFLMQPAPFVEKTCSGIKTSDGQLPDMTLDWMQTWGRNMADDYGSGHSIDAGTGTAWHGCHLARWTWRSNLKSSSA
ncbi:MAG: hypothetical protein Q6353_000285 [Candidatus Sigynarchaeum springense]